VGEAGIEPAASCV